MRKKYLSALLFGALLFASTGTFTSCKDYDDDINSLRNDVTSLQNAVSELQTAVQNGNYVTAVSKSGNIITFTFSGGSTTNIELDEDQVGSIVTVQDGVLYIDGEATEIKAAESTPGEEGDEAKDQIIIENGMWSVLQEDGTYLSTGIPVSGVNVSGSESTGWTLRVYASDGTYQDIELPTAASSLTDLIVTDEQASLEYYTYTFTYSGTGAPDRDKWAGPKTLPSDGKIIAATTTIPVQLNPTNIDGTAISFGLTDSQNNVPSNVVLTASENTKMVTVSRAAYGNGLYALTMDDVYFSNNQSSQLTAFENQFKSEGNLKGYAVKAGNVRSKYVVAVKEAATGATLSTVQVNDDANKRVGSAITVGNSTGNTVTVNAGEWYSVTATEDAALYDMHLSVDNNDKVLYGVEIVESEGSFTFRTTETPDNITKPSFDLTIETVDKNGAYKKTIVEIQQSDIIASGYVYDAQSYQLQAGAANKNYFSVGLAEMKTALGTQGAAIWNNQVANSSVKFYDADNKEITSPTGIDVEFVQNNTDGAASAGLTSANYIQFRITNMAAAAKFDVNKQYTAIITFTNGSGSELNSITVPFTLTLPAITTLYQLDTNFIVNGNAVCYMYEADQTSGEAAFKLNRVFSKADTSGNFTIKLDDETAVIDDMTSADLATVNSTFTSSTMATLKDNDPDGNSWVDKETGLEKGYGQVLTFTITGKYDGAWEYPKGEGFTFTARILSPIYEGSVTPREGSQVVIPASDLDGYQFGNDVIIGNTYNTAVTYDVLPIWKNNGSVYSREDIKAVSAKSGNTNIFTIESTPTDAQSPITSGNTTVKRDGYFEMHSQNVPQTSSTTVEITVTDIWGYSKTSSVPVQITVE